MGAVFGGSCLNWDLWDPVLVGEYPLRLDRGQDTKANELVQHNDIVGL